MLAGLQSNSLAFKTISTVTASRAGEKPGSEEGVALSEGGVLILWSYSLLSEPQRPRIVKEELCLAVLSQSE